MKIKQTSFILAVLVSVVGVSLMMTSYAFADCAGIKTAFINCDGTDGVMGILKLAIQILTAGVGLAALGGIVYGAVLYSSAGGNVDQAKQARTIIFNVVIGLVCFALAFSFLNWLIPGLVW